MTRKTGPLSPQEAALWNKVAATVEPLEAKRAAKPVMQASVFSDAAVQKSDKKKFGTLISSSSSEETEGVMARHGRAGEAKAGNAFNRFPPPQTPPLKERGLSNDARQGLDSHWDRRFVRGRIEPDLTVDLHGHTLSTAYTRLDQSLALAIGAGFRVILLITGKARSEDARDARGNRRGAIRAAVSDWLAASRHAGSIAAVRNAHPRHGGNGALYIVLKR